MRSGSIGCALTHARTRLWSLAVQLNLLLNGVDKEDWPALPHRPVHRPLAPTCAPGLALDVSILAAARAMDVPAAPPERSPELQLAAAKAAAAQRLFNTVAETKKRAEATAAATKKKKKEEKEVAGRVERLHALPGPEQAAIVHQRRVKRTQEQQAKKRQAAVDALRHMADGDPEAVRRAAMLAATLPDPTTMPRLPLPPPRPLLPGWTPPAAWSPPPPPPPPPPPAAPEAAPTGKEPKMALIVRCASGASGGGREGPKKRDGRGMGGMGEGRAGGRASVQCVPRPVTDNAFCSRASARAVCYPL